MITWAEAAGKASLSGFLKVDRKMETAEWVVKTKSCWEALTQDVDAEGTGRSRFSLQAACELHAYSLEKGYIFKSSRKVYVFLRICFIRNIQKSYALCPIILSSSNSGWS